MWTPLVCDYMIIFFPFLFLCDITSSSLWMPDSGDYAHIGEHRDGGGGGTVRPLNPTPLPLAWTPELSVHVRAVGSMATMAMAVDQLP